MSETEDKKQKDLKAFQSRINELEKEKSVCKDKDRLDRIEQELYAYKQEIRMLAEVKEEPENKKKRKRR